MAMPVVIVPSGGLPVMAVTTGFGTPVEVAANGYGTAVTQVTNYGMPVVFGVPQINPGNQPDRTFDWTLNKVYSPIAELPGSASSLLTVTRAGTANMDDNAGNWTSVAANTARVSNKGLLIETARTNSIRNNSMQGAAAGSPGTLPTNWIAAGLVNAGTRTVVGTGVVNGIDYIDLRFSGVPATVGPHTIAFDVAVGNIAEVWSNSFFCALVGGDLTNLQGGIFTLRAGGEGGGTIFTPTSTLQRVINTRTLGAANGICTLRWVYDALTPVDFTLRIGWPQSELGAFVSSPIRTTTVAVTRAADVVNMTGLTFGSAYSMFAKFVPTSPLSNAAIQTVLGITNGSTTNRHLIYRVATTGQAASFSTSAGVTQQAANIATVLVSNAANKMAGALAASDIAVSANSLLANNTAAATLPVGPITTLAIGHNGGGASNFEGYIQQSAYWTSQRVPNAQLQSMTVGLDVTAPTITSANTVSNVEDTVLAHTLTANETVTWTKTGGADTARFEISGNTLRWLSNGVKDFETPNDADTNNAYVVQVTATDTTGNVSTTQTITVTVTNVTGAAPDAPVLDLLTDGTDNTPDFTLTGDLAEGDTVRFQYSTSAVFSGASETTNTIDAAEDAANSLNFATGTLANNTWYFRARIERPSAEGAGISGWSNTETIAISAGGGPATTWDPTHLYQDAGGSLTLSGGNLTATAGFLGAYPIVSVYGTNGRSTGKLYFEITMPDLGYQAQIGLADRTGPQNATDVPGIHNTTGVVTNAGEGNTSSVVQGGLREDGGGSYLAINAAIFAGDVFGFAIDLDAMKLWISVNGVWGPILGISGGGPGNPATGSGECNLNGAIGKPLYPYISSRSATNPDGIFILNVGATAFVYSVPSGFSAWG